MIPSPVLRMLERLRASMTDEDARARLSPRSDAPARAWRTRRRATSEGVDAAWERLLAETKATPADRAALADAETTRDAGLYEANIESFVGTTKLPVGIAGPLRVNGLNARGDYLVPLATSEAALVASYARGADILTRAGGVSAALLYEGVLRSPAFLFGDIVEAGLFVAWVASEAERLKAAAEATTRFGKLVSIEPLIDSDVVFLLCRYTTGDAAGQNMVTIATDALCRHIEEACPIRPRAWFVEGNFAGDKKASFLGLMTGRGRKVTASAVIPAELIERCLHTSVERLLDYARVAELGAKLSGQLGAQGHYANGLAALYIATGQDAACVSESAVGFTRMEPRPEGLFMSVTMPNILVGSVGGGTRLPTQAAGLRILGLEGPGNAAALAEVTAALCLAGELSIMGAMAAGHFTRAHGKLARER